MYVDPCPFYIGRDSQEIFIITFHNKASDQDFVFQDLFAIVESII